METTQAPLRAVSYSRVSTADQLKSNITIKASLDDQRGLAEREAEKRGWRYLEDYREEGESGEELEERAELQRLLLDARAGKFDVLICRHSDRLGRVSYILHYLYHRLEVECKVQIYNANNPPAIVPKEEYSPRRDNSRVFRRGLETLIVESESNDRAKRLEQGRVTQIRAGRRIFASPPYGYVNQPVIKDGKLDRVPVPDPATYPIVEMLPRLILEERLSLREILTRLTQVAAPTPGSKIWRKAALRYILANPFYAGVQAYHVRVEVRDETTGRKKLVKNPDPSTIEYFPHKYPHPWTWETYQAMNRLLDERGRQPPRSLGSPSPFPAGLLRCGHCGGTMIYIKTGVIGAGTPYFLCRDHNLNRALCFYHNVPANKLLAFVWHDLDEISRQAKAAGPETYFASRQAEAEQRLIAALSGQVSNLERELAEELPAKRDRLNRDYLAGRLEAGDRAEMLAILAEDEKYLQERRRNIARQLEEAGARLGAKSRQASALEQWQVVRGQVIGVSIIHWPSELPRKLQALLETLFERISVKAEYDRAIPTRNQKWRIEATFDRKEP
jgi:hypothetical protein